MGGLKIIPLADPQPGRALVTVDQRLWLTADRRTVVPDGDPRAAILFATPGTEIPRTEAQRYGLLKAADEPDDDKSRTKTEDKNRKPTGDK